MPCSCGNTNCPCGIPCYCSEESCKCQFCAIALSRFCKICNKPLITEIQTNDEKCSCFLGEFTAFISKNQNNTQCRKNNMPLPVGYVVSGNLTMNLMFPVPVLPIPQFTENQPTYLMPSEPPLIQAGSKTISPVASEEKVVNSICPKEDSGLVSSSTLSQFRKRPSNPSNGFCSNDEQNTKPSCKTTCLPESSQFTDDKQITNTAINTKPKSEELTNIQESSSTNHCSNDKLNTKPIYQKACLPTLSQPTDKLAVNRVQSTKPEKDCALTKGPIGNQPIFHHQKFYSISTPLSVASTSALSKNDCLQVFSSDGFPCQSSEITPITPFCKFHMWPPCTPFTDPKATPVYFMSGPQRSLSTTSESLVIENSENSEESESSIYVDHSYLVEEKNRKNSLINLLNSSLALNQYIDPSTTLKMNKVLKPTL